MIRSKYPKQKDLEDTDPMPMGNKFLGVPMADVPAWYLLFLRKKGIARGNVRSYIDKNIDLLEKENQKNAYN